MIIEGGFAVFGPKSPVPIFNLANLAQAEYSAKTISLSGKATVYEQMAGGKLRLRSVFENGEKMPLFVVEEPNVQENQT